MSMFFNLWSNPPEKTGKSPTSYDFHFSALLGKKNINLSDFKGKVILIVNTASKCGFTKQFKDLETLYETYKEKGLVIIGVPSDDFGKQEFSSQEDIANFCKLNYGVSFPMTKKETIVGKNAHPFYVWARKTLGFVAAPHWNFHKYLINRKGELIDYFSSITSPKSAKLISAVEKALNETA